MEGDERDRPASRVDDPLLRAIGRVVVDSAELDELLRYIANDLLGYSDESWVIFEGQPTEWLIQTCEALVTEHLGQPYTREHPRTDYSAISDCLKDLRNLKQVRNAVVHGTWEDEFTGIVAPRSPPWPHEPGETFCCSQSRRHRSAHEWVLTTGDVERTAQELRSLTDRLRRAWRNNRD